MSTLAHWLATGVVHGTVFFGAAWLLAVTVLREAHPASRAALFFVALLKFAVPFGPSFELSWPAPAASAGPATALAGHVTVVANAASAGTDWLVAAWLFGVLAIGTVRVVRYVRHRRALRSHAAPPELLERVAELARRAGVARPPRTVLGESGPCLVGAWRPVLVVPPGADGVDMDAMLAHELAHLRRGDPLVRLLQVVVETLFFFWPVVRLASRQLHLAREQACDLAVVETGIIAPARYAELLLELGLASSPTLAMAAQPTHLERRIDMVLSYLQEKHPKRRWATVAMLALAGVACSGVSLAAVPAPAVHPPRLKVDGQLDPRQVQTVIFTNADDVRACYRDFLATHPPAEGKLVLHWAVKDDGSVAETCQSEGTTIPRALGRCVSERVASWRFPPANYSQEASVEYTFEFANEAPGLE